MTKIEEIAQEIQRLTPAELAAFRAWFHRYDADAWDVQIEHNIATARTQLDEVTFAAAWAEGRAMTTERAEAFALETLNA